MAPRRRPPPGPQAPVANGPQPAAVHDGPTGPTPAEHGVDAARSRRPPLRFREDVSGRPAPHVPQVDEEPEETFDLANVSGTDEDEEPPVPRARGSQFANDPVSTTTSDPLMTTQSSQKQSSTPSSADVAFFFPKRKGEPTSCTVCQ